MKTDELIDRLGREVTVVTPLSAARVRTALWSIWAVMYLSIVAAVMFSTIGSVRVVPTPLYSLQQGAAFVTGLMAARAAFASVIPGASHRAWVLPAVAATVWVALLLSAGVLDLRASGTLGLAAESDWPCVASMTMGGMVVGLPLLWMVRRGAPLTPRTTAVLGGLAALSIANIEACLTRPHTFAMTVLLWHGATIAGVATLCALMGRRWLRWPTVTVR